MNDSAIEIAEDEEQVLTYEEVTLYLTRTGRKRPIVLVGPPKVGCLELRARLMEADKDKFAGVVPRKFLCKFMFFQAQSVKTDNSDPKPIPIIRNRQIDLKFRG